MTDAANNNRITDAAHHAAEATAQRVASQLGGIGICVATIDSAGTLHPVNTDVSRFFTRYAIPALQLLGKIDEASGAVDTRLPGVCAIAITAPMKRVSGASLAVAAPTFLLLARHENISPDNEELQRWCSRLQLDAPWLTEEAARVMPVAPAVLQRLSEFTIATGTADLRAASLQNELDSVSGQLSDTYEELALIYQISSGMRVNRKVNDFFLQACTDVLGVMGVRAAGYAVVDSHGCVDSSEMFGEITLPSNVIRRLQDDLILRFSASPTPLLNNRLAEDPSADYLAAFASHLVAVPIQRQDNMLGLLFCLDKIDADFTTQDSKLLNSIANETAIYLENSSLFADARGMMMGLLHALTSAVDAKDTYTCGHSQRVAIFGREIAVRAGLSEQLCERVYMAGLLHDVGKIGVPEEVLRKPGKLTDHEFAQMKTHVTIGARILKDVKQVGDLIPGVLYHHERYDGLGYPHGLAGQNIPLIARILCVADSFDAMTSNRTYRKAMPIEIALVEIGRCANTQFDPILTEAFLSIGAARLRELIGSVTDQMEIQLAA